MITIQSALNQNREVFAVPHPIGGNNSEGCNSLIRDGSAKLVITADDILNEITHLRRSDKETSAKSEPSPAKWEAADLSEKQEQICRQLDEYDAPMHIDLLAEHLDCSTSELMVDLLSLEMMGCIEQSAGKFFKLL